MNFSQYRITDFFFVFVVLHRLKFSEFSLNLRDFLKFRVYIRVSMKEVSSRPLNRYGY